MRHLGVAIGLLVIGYCYDSACAQSKVPTASTPIVHEGFGGEENVIESFAVRANGDDLLIPVTVAGHEYQFILDTGTSMSIFDTSLKSLLVPTGKKIPVNGKGAVRLYECRNATVGRSKIALGKWTVCSDLEQIRQSCGDNIRGLLGMDFLRQLIVEVDFDAGRVKFLKSGKDAPGRKLPMQFMGEYGRPTIAGRLVGQMEVPLAIDTGMYGLNNGGLSGPTMDSLARAGQIQMLGTEWSATLNGAIEGRVGLVTSISVSDFTHTRQLFHESPFGRDALGLGYLSRYKVTFDFPGGALFLATGKRFDRRFSYKNADVYIGLIDGNAVILDADPGRRMWGIEAGDQILDINGMDARGMSLYSARELLSELDDGAKLLLRPEGGKPRIGYLRALLLHPTNP